MRESTFFKETGNPGVKTQCDAAFTTFLDKPGQPDLQQVLKIYILLPTLILQLQASCFCYVYSKKNKTKQTQLTNTPPCP